MPPTWGVETQLTTTSSTTEPWEARPQSATPHPLHGRQPSRQHPTHPPKRFASHLARRSWKLSQKKLQRIFKRIPRGEQPFGCLDRHHGHQDCDHGLASESTAHDNAIAAELLHSLHNWDCPIRINKH